MCVIDYPNGKLLFQVPVQCLNALVIELYDPSTLGADKMSMIRFIEVFFK
jgi:hypothetical protein